MIFIDIPVLYKPDGGHDIDYESLGIPGLKDEFNLDDCKEKSVTINVEYIQYMEDTKNGCIVQLTDDYCFVSTVTSKEIVDAIRDSLPNKK